MPLGLRSENRTRSDQRSVVANACQTANNETMGRSPKSRTSPSPFSKLLVSLMEEKGLGVREAARVAQVSPSTIVSWRSGSLPEDYRAVKRLAKELGVSLSFLLTGEDETRLAGIPSVSEVFEDGGVYFDGYARIKIERLIPKRSSGSPDEEK